MNCPKCKCPNPPGAPYCNMCYEVLTHSAAEAFLRSSRRGRLLEETQQQKGTPAPIGSVISDTAAITKEIDWAGLSQTTTQAVKRFKHVILWGAVALATFLLIRVLCASETWFYLLGSRLNYPVALKAPQRYLVSYHYDLSAWTEKQGRLDTPLQHWTIEELGNVLLEKAKNSSSSKPRLTIRPQEWIQISHRGNQRQSRAFPLYHPSLAPASVLLDKNGMVLQRKFQLSPRLAKGVDFLVPRFPKGFLRKGRTWEEPIEWVETIGDWKIHWSGRLKWTLDGQQDCGPDACAHLTYQAALKPKIWESPSWAVRAIGRPTFIGNATGEAFFNIDKKMLYSNDLKQNGVIRIPLSDVGRIPRHLRVGRKVRGPGDIVLQLSNRTTIK